MEVKETDARDCKMQERTDRNTSKQKEVRAQPSQGAPGDMMKLLEVIQDLMRGMHR